jgi:hypothetical protein
MPHPWAIALFAMATVLFIRPSQQEYGAEGWLWALFGLSHRKHETENHPRPRQPARAG